MFDKAGIGFSYETEARYSCPADRPKLARCTVSHILVIHRSDGDAAISSSVSLVNGASGGQTEAHIEARWNGELLGTLDYGPETIAETAGTAKFRFAC